MKVFVLDKDKCVGCHNCQIACKDEFVGNEWMPYSKPQPDTDHFWMRVEEKVHGQVPKVTVEYTPVSCQHCADCALVKAAPEAVYRRDDGLVIIDPEKARGRQDLVDLCPYGTVFWNEELSLPQKCTGCAHLVDGGQLPHCVDLCGTGALRFGDEEDFADEIARASTLMPEKGTSPRFYYLNEPGLFVAGEVWDPVDNEIIEGAHVMLADEDGEQRTTRTNDFGDFWFRNLSSGRYTLEIEADGFEGISRTFDVAESLNVGDFALVRR